jgi:hypothetical protein
MTQPTGDPYSTRSGNPRKLAGLMSMAVQPSNEWSAQELAAMWMHQLDAPLLFDLSALSPRVGDTIAQATRVDPQPLSRFVDLLRHHRPPVEVLQWTKDFAKSHMVGGADAALPPDIAAVLYYGSILLARLRLGMRISELDETSLRRGVMRILEMPWLDEETHKLLASGLQSLAEQ